MITDSKFLSMMRNMPVQKQKKIGRFFNFFDKLLRFRRGRKQVNVTVYGISKEMKGNKEKYYGRPITDDRKTQSTTTSKRNVFNVVYKNLRNYCRHTTLHGLRYCGDSTLSTTERTFWLLAFSLAVCFAGYFISNIYHKYTNTPVIISFNPVSTSLLSIPFPAVTICNMNQAIKRKARQILKYGTEIENKLLNDYCTSNNSFPNISIASDDASSNWEVVRKFLTKVGQPCSEMLKLCLWHSSEIECDQLFTTHFTDDGLCCSFNRLPNSFIFRNPKENDDDLFYNTNLTVFEWNVEKGFEKDTSLYTVPWRSFGAGVHLGLSLVLDAAVDDYYCSATESAGFKVLLSNPVETPKMADFGFLVSPGRESRITIQPIINDATPTLQSIDISKRLCYFSKEKYLRYYRTYTELNCRLECQSNFTRNQCGCVPYFLPRNNKTNICGKNQEKCYKNFKLFFKESRKGIICDCLPGCFELSYSSALSFGMLSKKFRIKEAYLGKETADYFVKNMAVLHFYFEESQFQTHTKSEIFGFTEFLSSIGGLLGLFLGFSFLSAVELVYYLTMKICCYYLKVEMKMRFKEDETVVYPFVQ